MKRVPDSLLRALPRLRSRIAGIISNARMRIPHPRARIYRYIVFITLITALTVWSAYSAIKHATTEWRRLERAMNGGSWRVQGLASTSSFDWAGVQYFHLVRQDKPLPARKAGAIPRVQHRFRHETRRAGKLRRQRLGEVRAEFTRAWAAYKKFAWRMDALQPISALGTEQFSGWAATLVDSLDTLWIMGLREEFDEAVAAVAEIDFGKSSSREVNIFETTIRYLGGLLAAYDLSGRVILLKKAVELGDLIYAGFDTENGMPVEKIDHDRVKRGKVQFPEGLVVSASPGSLSLELAHLSQLTGDPKYYNAVDRVMDVFSDGQNRTALPGMWPMMVSMSRMDVVSGERFTLAGNADSLYEYIPKMHQLLGAGAAKYERMTRAFLETAREHVLYRPMVPNEKDILMPGNVEVVGGEISLDPETEHLACFVGGTYGLAARLFDEPEYLTTGIKLTDGCVYAYRSFPAKIMPERLNMVRCDNMDDCPWDEERWLEEARRRPEHKKHLPKGFTTAKDPRYLLRPEAVESVFYMYRLTGQSRFQDIAWDMFTAIRNGTRTKHANAAVVDVTMGVYPLPQEDYMESFWLAETLKYFYLMFSPPDIISLDDFVLNTEAHPFKILK